MTTRLLLLLQCLRVNANLSPSLSHLQNTPGFPFISHQVEKVLNYYLAVYPRRVPVSGFILLQKSIAHYTDG